MGRKSPLQPSPLSSPIKTHPLASETLKNITEASTFTLHWEQGKEEREEEIEGLVH